VSFRHLSGLESILCYDSGVDVAELTRHVEHVCEDLDLAKATGLDWFRYPWRWPAIERSRGRYDWGFTDEAMSHMRSLGIEPIVDPCHHVSLPAYLEGGFLNPSFPERYERFVLAAAERYGWVKQFTLMNEPYPTALFCGKTGFWYPYRRSSRAFVRIVANIAKAICSLSRRLSQMPGFVSIHFETCEHHKALEPATRDWAHSQNQMRFLVIDLILGRVNTQHPLYWYLTANGISRCELRWFEANPAQLDVLALDYYAHSEMRWSTGPDGFNAERPSQEPRGFADVALDYVERYEKPIMLGETNIRGAYTDRLSWLKYTYSEAERLAATPGVDFRGYGWFPLWDSCAWARDLCRTAKTETDPVGIYMLDSSRHRRLPSELSDVFTQLVHGHAGSSGIPAYRLGSDLEQALRGYEKFTRGWAWRDSEERVTFVA
jgi:beta-glucosidase